MIAQSITNFYEHPPQSGQAPQHIVMLLHGLGSNGQDLISLAPYWAQKIPDAVFISPDAPFACDMMPVGYPNAYQWFSLQDRSPDVMMQGTKATAPILYTFIEETLSRYALGADKMALVGFSQGTMMSLYAAPRFEHMLAGVLGYSGALVGGDELMRNVEDMNKMPVHLIHGEADDVVPVEAYHMARDALHKSGFSVSGYTTANLPHSIDEAGIESGSTFLSKILG